jgi:hypothetical protein
LHLRQNTDTTFRIRSNSDIGALNRKIKVYLKQPTMLIYCMV